VQNRLERGKEGLHPRVRLELGPEAVHARAQTGKLRLGVRVRSVHVDVAVRAGAVGGPGAQHLLDERRARVDNVLWELFLLGCTSVSGSKRN
jgi:hypothetical protein